MSIIYIKDNLKEIITKMEYSTLKLDYISSSGAIIIRFDIDDSTVSIINCFLEPSIYKMQNRIY